MLSFIFCSRRGIAAMGKPAERILSRNGGQRLDDCLLEGLAGTSTYPSQTRFYFGKRLFNWREIRRVCGQEEEAAAASLHGFPDTHALMNAQIIQNDNLSGVQAGSQDLLHIGLKGSCIGGSIQQ